MKLGWEETYEESDSYPVAVEGVRMGGGKDPGGGGFVGRLTDFLILSLVCGETDRNDSFLSISLLLGASAGFGTGMG